MADVTANFAETMGISSWNLGIGTVQTVLLWLFLSCLLVGFIGFFIGLWYYRRLYKHQVVVWGLVGKNVMEKYTSRAKEVPMGQAGDKLFYVAAKKRLISMPTLPAGKNKWYFYERLDGELINVAPENVDLAMKQIGVHYVDTDMRMQRLGIEKNLAYRLQGQTWWEKYGTTVVNLIFYVFITMMLIALFVQWRKTGQAINTAVATAGQVMERAAEINSGKRPTTEGEGSGLIPAIATVIILHFRIRRLKKCPKLPIS